MFEDATFESTGRIHTRSRRWMIVTLLFNGALLMALILIPMIYPEALPRQALPFLLTAPAPPPSTPPLPKETPHAFHGASEMQGSVILVPQKIPSGIFREMYREQVPEGMLVSMGPGAGLPDGGTGIFSSNARQVVRAEARGPVRLSSTMVAGLLIWKSVPQYPAIAKAAGMEGTVVLQATISKTGTIENLRVVSGPAMLQQAALDAVKAWRYRPYLLDGLPVEVETTVNVVFKLAR
ncbi:MAG: energy transducer TonB [Terracidiphilus sp.]